MGAYYMECSSKEMDGVEEIFDRAIEIAVGDEYKVKEAAKANNSRMGATPSNVMASSTSAKPTSNSGYNHNNNNVMVVPPKKKKSRSCKIL